MTENNSIMSLLNIIDRLNYTEINDFPEYLYNECLENGEDPFLYLAVAIKGEAFFKKLKDLFNKSDYTIRELEKKDKKIQSNGVEFSLQTKNEYDYSDVPALKVFLSDKEKIDSIIKQIQEVARKIRTTTDYPVEGGEEVLKITPAYKKSYDIAVCKILK